MFGKDKVKSYSRVSKGKSGYKVIRVKEFLRKKDEKDNTVRNIVLGVGAISTLGIGTALLLKKKGSIKFPGQVNKTNSLVKVQEKVAVPKPSSAVKNSDMTPGEKFIKEMDEEWGIGKKKVSSNEASSVITPTGKKNDMPELRDFWNTKNTPGTRMLEKGDRLLRVSKRASNIRKKTGFSKISDPWSTPIKSSIKESTEKVIQETDNIKALAPAKTPSPRGNLKKREMLVVSDKKKVTSSVVNMRNTQKNYDSLPVEMKVIVQIEKALTRPIKSSIGRPPDTKGLKTILRESEELPIEKVISKAKRKVSDRLKRQGEEVAKRKASDISKSNSELKKN